MTLTKRNCTLSIIIFKKDKKKKIKQFQMHKGVKKMKSYQTNTSVCSTNESTSNEMNVIAYYQTHSRTHRTVCVFVCIHIENYVNVITISTLVLGF